MGGMGEVRHTVSFGREHVTSAREFSFDLENAQWFKPDTSAINATE